MKTADMNYFFIAELRNLSLNPRRSVNKTLGTLYAKLTTSGHLGVGGKALEKLKIFKKTLKS